MTWLLVAILNGIPIGIEEHANFIQCMEGPGVIAMQPAKACSSCGCPKGIQCFLLCWAMYDTDRDADIDLADWAKVQQAFKE